MSDSILLRDLPLSWDCPGCGAKASRGGDLHVRERGRCDPDCTYIHTDREYR